MSRARQCLLLLVAVFALYAWLVLHYVRSATQPVMFSPPSPSVPSAAANGSGARASEHALATVPRESNAVCSSAEFTDGAGDFDMAIVVFAWRRVASRLVESLLRAHYCGADCFRADWKAVHRRICGKAPEPMALIAAT